MSRKPEVEIIISELAAAIEELQILDFSESLLTTPLIEMGLDSLSVTHLREHILEEYGVDIPPALLGFEIDTLEACAAFIAHAEDDGGRTSDAVVTQLADDTHGAYL